MNNFFCVYSGLLVSFLYFRTTAKVDVNKLTKTTGFLSNFIEFIGLLIYRFCRLIARAKLLADYNDLLFDLIIKFPNVYAQTYCTVFLRFGRGTADNEMVPLQFRVRPPDRWPLKLPEILVEKSAVRQYPVPRSRHGE